MDSVAVTVPLRSATKKMKKRKELDALAPPHTVSRRSSNKRSSQELLSESTDERSKSWNMHGQRGGPRKVRVPRGNMGHSSCLGLMRACGLFFVGTLFLVNGFLVWLFIDVRQQLTALRAEVDQVIAGSEGIPDALQTCHTLDRNFKTNITHITDEIRKLNHSLSNISGQISNLQRELQQLQVSLKSAPELTSVPNTVKALQNSIGQLEIDIHDLKTSYKVVKNGAFSLQQTQDKQQISLTKIENTLMELSNTIQQSQTLPSNKTLIETGKLWNAISHLRKNLTDINQILTMNITWAQEDLANDHKKVVSLQDMAQNASAQILTLQQECIRKKDQEILQNYLQSLSNRIDDLFISKNNPETSKQIREIYNNSQNQQRSVQKNIENTTEITYKASVDSEVLSASSSSATKQRSLNRK